MGIRFQCEHCQHGLNLKSELAGRRGICPKCKGKFRIPLESVSRDSDTDSALLESEALSSEFTLPPVISPVSGPLYWVCPPSGGRYGPADRTLLLEWARQDRITKDSLLVEVAPKADSSDATPMNVSQGVRADILLADFYHHQSYRLLDYSTAREKPVDMLAANRALKQSSREGMTAHKPSTHAVVRAKRTRARNRNLVVICLMIAVAVLLCVALFTVLNRK